MSVSLLVLSMTLAQSWPADAGVSSEVTARLKVVQSGDAASRQNAYRALARAGNRYRLSVVERYREGNYSHSKCGWVIGAGVNDLWACWEKWISTGPIKSSSGLRLEVLRAPREYRRRFSVPDGRQSDDDQMLGCSFREEGRGAHSGEPGSEEWVRVTRCELVAIDVARGHAGYQCHRPGLPDSIEEHPLYFDESVPPEKQQPCSAAW